MSQHQKVIWYEGMALDPHHFQQWDRYHRAIIDFRIRSIVHFDWGLLDISIDKEALVNGQFNLLRCKGVTPDGLRFNIPDESSLPASRNFEEYFPATEHNLGVFLAVPTEKERGINCRQESDQNKKDSRFGMSNISVTDDNTGADERQIAIGLPNFQLRFGNESMEDFDVLKIAEIIRSSDGSFALSDSYIPPCLSIEASENLKKMLRRLLELLIAKIASVGSESHLNRQIDFTARDLIIFGIIRTLNAFIPLLNHFHTLSKAHPEELYIHLLSLAGVLTTYSSETVIDARSLPVYDHNSLSKCFDLIDKKIRDLLDRIVPSANYIPIPLEKQSESLFVGRVGDSSLFQGAKFYLSVGGDFPEHKIIDEVPVNVRIASPDTINAVLSSFSKALPIKHSAGPPPGLTKREGIQYFRIEPTGPFWDAICRSNALAIFIPLELRSLSVEVIAVR
jgi:type VI secretion system protein ImpJ